MRCGYTALSDLGCVVKKGKPGKMKHIKLLPDITVTNMQGKEMMEGEGKPLVRKHIDVLLERLTDPGIIKSFAKLEMATKIKAAGLKAREEKAEYLTLDDAWHALLWELIDAPSAPIQAHPLVVMSDFPFLQAVKDAVDELPPTDTPPALVEKVDE